MKHYRLIFLSIIVVNLSLNAQISHGGYLVPFESCEDCLNTNNQYSGVIDFFETRNIVSDFGPRYLSSNTPYDFHGGIDYTITEPIDGAPNDLGYHIFSITSGTIVKLEFYNNGPLKYMVIDGPSSNDFGYLHLFSDLPPPNHIGDMIFVEVQNNVNIEDKVYGIFDISNDILYSDCFGWVCGSNFFYIYNQDTIYATNQVSANSKIAILGDSGGASIGSHLHLSKYNSLNVTDYINNDLNAIDPLDTVAHLGPEYDVNILHDSIVPNIDNYPEGVKIKYPGDKPTSILIRPIMRDIENGLPNNGILTGSNRIYNNNTLNIHKVELLVSSDALLEDYIQGPFFASKIFMGARYNDNTKYPNHIHQRSADNVGSWTRTGIKPLAYKTNSPRRWDDFYFADFVTRIHEDDNPTLPSTPTVIADIPENLRYKDGMYDIKAMVTDVRDSTFSSDMHTFTLDNFKPYLSKIKIYTSNFFLNQKELLTTITRNADEGTSALNDGFLSNAIT